MLRCNMNQPLSKFFMLEKMDPFQGIAIGVAAAEELDHDNEILDYLGSKPYFQKWSDSQFAASGGKSKGNVRLQHDEKKPVGVLTDINYDDAAKMVRVVAKIVDQNARELLASGVLTGFSIGGDYIKRTPMPNGAVRYIAGPSEISVCDRPCAPSATYSVVKGDGRLELRKFAKQTVVKDDPFTRKLGVERPALGKAQKAVLSKEPVLWDPSKKRPR